MSRIAAALAIVALTVAACGQPDPWCDDRSTPIGTDVLVGIFTEAGVPLCGGVSRIHVSQHDFASDEFMLLLTGHFELNEQGKILERPGDPCNAYLVQGAPNWHPCGGWWVDVTVEAAGCETATVHWTWPDNTYPERFGLNYLVPVRMRCSGS